MGPDGLNVSDNYLLDNGQRDNVYDISRLVLKDGRPAATGDLTITYAYFDHDGVGDFFSADSYTNEDGIGFTAIPTYVPTSIIPNGTQDNSGYQLFLRDLLTSVLLLTPLVLMLQRSPGSSLV